MNCIYERTADGRLWKCVRQNCGHETLAREHHKEPPKRTNCCASLPQDRCQQLGSVVGERECDTCLGSTRIKLYACAIHGSATLGKKLDGIQTCAQCPDYATSKRDESPDDGRNG